MQFAIMDELPPDAPDQIVLTRRQVNDLQGPLMAALRRYVDLMSEAEELLQQNPYLSALVEAIQERKVKKLTRLIENDGDVSAARYKRVQRTLTELRQGESARES
jgi:hypothetical protein